VTLAPFIDVQRQRRRLLQGRLHDAEDDYDDVCRERFAGVTGAALHADKACWRELGGAIASLARLISMACASSQFCLARPQPDLLAARISEAIDNQLDESAWAVIDAAARVDAARG
jgi:hypothetical protein